LFAVAALAAALTACGSSRHSSTGRTDATTGRTTRTPTHETARWFFVPGAHTGCELGLNRGDLGTYVYCEADRPHRRYPKGIAVTMYPSGDLKRCHGLCLSNAPYDEPPLHRRQSMSLGPFRCTALRDGVRCVVTELGRGFSLSVRGLKRI
jgi:hypothetical protein